MGTAELMIIGRTLPYTLRNNFSSLKQFHAPLDLKYYYLKLAVSYRKPVSVLGKKRVILLSAVPEVIILSSRKSN